MSGNSASMSFNYEDNNPIVHVKLTINDEELDVPAYADTGCSSAVVITKRLADIYGLREQDSNSEDQEAILADGSKIICRLYFLPAKIEKFETIIKLVVLYPHQEITSGLTTESYDEPLLGREIMDRFNVLFAGTSSPKAITFDSNVSS